MPKTKVLVSIEDDVLAALDKVAEGLEISRSSAVEACVESSLVDWEFLGHVGVTPRRLRQFGLWLMKLKRHSYGSVDIDPERAVRAIEGLTGERTSS